MPIDPVIVGILLAVGLLFFGLFLLLRRTAVGFREGYDRGRNR